MKFSIDNAVAETSLPTRGIYPSRSAAVKLLHAPTPGRRDSTSSMSFDNQSSVDQQRAVIANLFADATRPSLLKHWEHRHRSPRRRRRRRLPAGANQKNSRAVAKTVFAAASKTTARPRLGHRRRRD